MLVLNLYTKLEKRKCYLLSKLVAVVGLEGGADLCSVAYKVDNKMNFTSCHSLKMCCFINAHIHSLQCVPNLSPVRLL